MSDRTRTEADGHYEDALYYDHAYARYKDDLGFYAALAERFGGPVLELGVGTARVAMAVAATGADVIGVDRMPGMLERARARLAKKPRRIRDRVELIEGDFRDLSLARRFPLVIAPFNALQHLYSREDIERALATVHAHVAPGGVFAFDVLLPEPHSLARDPDRFFKSKPITHPEDRRRYDYSEAFFYDADRQVQTTTIRLISREPPRRVIIDRLTQRQFFPREIEALLHYNHFDVERHDGGFAGEDIEEGTESQVIVARPRPR